MVQTSRAKCDAVWYAVGLGFLLVNVGIGLWLGITTGEKKRPPWCEYDLSRAPPETWTFWSEDTCNVSRADAVRHPSQLVWWRPSPERCLPTTLEWFLLDV